MVQIRSRFKVKIKTVDAALVIKISTETDSRFNNWRLVR